MRWECWIAVAALTWFGHIGRAVFAVMTLLFVGLGIAVLVGGLGAAIPAHHAAPSHAPGHAAFIALLLAFPVAMALATGVEAPSSAIAQLGQLDDAGRRRFGRITLWLTLAIVAVLTLGLTTVAEAAHRHPKPELDPGRDIASASAGSRLYFAFQLFTALLLLAAAASSFRRPGLLKALARQTRRRARRPASSTGISAIPTSTTPPTGPSASSSSSRQAVASAAGGHDQELVLFYAVSVFMSFLVGLVAMARFSLAEGRRWWLMMNATGALVVAFTLGVNLSRGNPIARWPQPC